VREACDILPSPAEREHQARNKGPKAVNKWLTGSVEHSAASVVTDVFAQAHARDPGRRRPWIVLVDGAAHQLELIHAEAKRRKAKIHVIVDFIHVLPAPAGALTVPKPSSSSVPCGRTATSTTTGAITSS
jgi:hypothetical protein